uniref:Uncharacterized protein n=1 Tax=Avena sativa TaxID=4498 RepID=A0ACD5WDF2_AVESA
MVSPSAYMFSGTQRCRFLHLARPFPIERRVSCASNVLPLTNQTTGLSSIASNKIPLRQDPKYPTHHLHLKKNSSSERAETREGAMNNSHVEEEVGKLKEEIQRLGQQQPDGSYKVKFGVIFNDDRCANIFEALVGTLRAAKKRKIVTYDGEMLLQGVHDNVEIILLPPAVAAA